MKNLAGNEVSIFLFRFILRENGINFVLNETIAEDMYPEIDAELQPLIQACGETLLRYKDHCHEETIMDGNILTDDCFEVMLFKGLGQYFIENEKQNLFNDANEISNLLLDVMDRRSKEMEEGIYPGPQPVINKTGSTGTTTKGLEALGQKRHTFHWKPGERPDLTQLKPEDLPLGVVAKRSYDHRGYSVAFEHRTLGELGKIVLSDVDGNKTLMETELSIGNGENLEAKRKELEKIIKIVNAAMRKIPEH